MRKRIWFSHNRRHYEKYLRVLNDSDMKDSDKNNLRYWIFAYFHQADVTDRYKLAIWIIIILDLINWILR